MRPKNYTDSHTNNEDESTMSKYIKQQLASSLTEITQQQAVSVQC